MFKRRMLAATGRCSHHKKHKGENSTNEEDRISRLPDELLMSILSLLTLKEAARTSVLSPRWRKVWTFIYSLIFCWETQIEKLVGNKLRHRSVKWVNGVLDAYQGEIIDELELKFYLNAKYDPEIDKWFKFALEKKAKRLVMDFRKLIDDYRYSIGSRPSLACNAEFLDCRSLKDLKLKGVNVSEGVIGCLLSSCLYLERVNIDGSNSIVDLNISGPLPCLKVLKITDCDYLKSIFLSATNLLSFKYSGHEIRINFANVPHLMDLYLGSDCCMAMLPRFWQLAIDMSRLETLTLYMQPPKSKKLLKFPLLRHLKNMKLIVDVSDINGLLDFALLMKKTPSLCRLVLDFNLFENKREETAISEEVPKCPLECLKVVETICFMGRACEMAFATFLIENAVNLEKMIMDHPLMKNQCRPDVYQRVKERTMQLESRFSLGDKLVFRDL